MSSAAPIRLRWGNGSNFSAVCPEVDDGADFRHHAFVGVEIPAVRVCIEQDVVADLAAEQLIDRLVQHLAADVPQRDVDAADHIGRRAA